MIDFQKLCVLTWNNAPESYHVLAPSNDHHSHFLLRLFLYNPTPAISFCRVFPPLISLSQQNCKNKRVIYSPPYRVPLIEIRSIYLLFNQSVNTALIVSLQHKWWRNWNLFSTNSWKNLQKYATLTLTSLHSHFGEQNSQQKLQKYILQATTCTPHGSGWLFKVIWWKTKPKKPRVY